MLQRWSIAFAAALIGGTAVMMTLAAENRDDDKPPPRPQNREARPDEPRRRPPTPEGDQKQGPQRPQVHGERSKPQVAPESRPPISDDRDGDRPQARGEHRDGPRDDAKPEARGEHRDGPRDGAKPEARGEHRDSPRPGPHAAPPARPQQMSRQDIERRMDQLRAELRELHEKLERQGGESHGKQHRPGPAAEPRGPSSGFHAPMDDRRGEFRPTDRRPGGPGPSAAMRDFHPPMSGDHFAPPAGHGPRPGPGGPRPDAHAGPQDRGPEPHHGGPPPRDGVDRRGDRAPDRGRDDNDRDRFDDRRDAPPPPQSRSRRPTF